MSVLLAIWLGLAGYFLFGVGLASSKIGPVVAGALLFSLSVVVAMGVN